MLSVEAITQNIVRQLQLLDPAASAEVGTPERKIIESVAEIIAQFQVDFSILTQQHDLTTMTGGRLDAYLGNFGFARQIPTPAIGIVTFFRDSPASQAIVIPRGTQVRATIDDSAFPDITFVTLDTVVLAVGESEVSSTVTCSVPGSIGNVSASSISSFAGLRSISGITGVRNDDACFGGTDGEDDSQLKIRFQNSLFRNMAGTYDNFLALAVSAPSVTKANVIGPVSRFQEYVQVPEEDDTDQTTAPGSYDPAGTYWPHKRSTAISTIPYSKYTYLEQFYLTDGNLDPAIARFFRHGVDFIFNSPPVDPAPPNDPVSSPDDDLKPNVTFLGIDDTGDPVFASGELVPGDTVLLEHAYMSISSRNNYDLGILNAIDILIDGGAPTTASSVEIVPNASYTLQDDNAATFTYQLTGQPDPDDNVVNFRRSLDGRPAKAGNRITPEYWQPALSVPNSVQINGNTFYRANLYDDNTATYYNDTDTDGTPILKAHYCHVEEVNNLYGTHAARNGIEWFIADTNNYQPGRLSDDDQNNFNGVKIDNISLQSRQFELDNYTFDRNVTDLQAAMDKNKQVTTDVLVHRAKLRYFKPFLTVMYTIGSNKNVVDASIYSALAVFFNSLYYGAAVQLSDILQAVHNVPGVDNVRWTADTIPDSVEWRSNIPVIVGDYVHPTDTNDTGFTYLVTVSDGAAGTTEPTWPTTLGATVTLDGVTYKAIGIRYMIEEVRVDGNSLPDDPSYIYDDYFVLDNELAQAPDDQVAVIQRRAQNTWRQNTLQTL